MADGLIKYPNDFTSFCGDMVVPIGGKYGRFADHWDDKQETFIKGLAPSAHAVLRGDVPPVKRFYANMTKGYGKDQICTLLLLFVLMFAERPTRSQLIANKLQQANEPLDIMRGILWADGPLNRLAAKVIDLQNYRVISHQGTSRPESVVEVLASDRQAHGSRPTILACNEISHIEDELHFRTADDNLAKCPHGLGLYLSNAGFLGSWQHVWHEQVLSDPLFKCTIVNTPAPWIDRKVLEHKARIDIPSRHEQYFYGVWVSPSGDVLPREQIERAIVLPEPQCRESAYTYLAFADLSTTTNRSGLCVFGVAADRPIVLAEAVSWKPQEYVDRSEFIRELKADIKALRDKFDIKLLGFDQHQSSMLIDLCSKLNINTFEYYAAAKNFDDVKNNGTMRAEMLFRAFQEQWVRIFRCEQLLLDLKATSIITKAGGSKLEFASDTEGGHGDLADSFSSGLLLAINLQTSYRHNLIRYGSQTGPRDEVLIA